MPRQKAAKLGVEPGRKKFGQSRVPSLNQKSTENSLRLWTIQHVPAWDEFLRKGILRGDGRRVYRQFRFAYHWILKQMKLRVPGYSGRYPIWAWLIPKPDLCRTACLAPGEKGVRIEVIVPQERVLLSDFYAWHVVLNQGYLALSDKEDQEWELKTDRLGWNEKQRSGHLRRELEKSWERIFDVEALRASGWSGTGSCIQATVEEIYLDEVVNVKEFTAR